VNNHTSIGKIAVLVVAVVLLAMVIAEVRLRLHPSAIGR
jgi:hypothetical protein